MPRPPRPRAIHGVLIDISGVLMIDGVSLPGAPEALQRLRDAGLPLRFVTNTTRRPPATLVERLQDGGFDVTPDEVFAAPTAALEAAKTRGLHPWLVVHEGLRPMFNDIAADRAENADAVVIGDAGDGFSYAALNDAFRVLMNTESPALIAMGVNRFFREGDGRLSLDAGPFVRLLEEATGLQSEVVGKPSQGFFDAALHSIATSAEHAAMIGDDLRDDVGGAQACGLHGILVRTGKYRPEDESDRTVTPDVICDDFVAAVESILDKRA